MTWRAYRKVAEDNYHKQEFRSCTAGINSGRAVIIGGKVLHRPDLFLKDKQIMLEFKRLQHLAMKTEKSYHCSCTLQNLHPFSMYDCMVE